MKTKRFVSTLLALLLICSLPVSAFADTWYLENGDITVNATESGQTVTQGAQVDVPDSAPVITQSNSSTPTTNTISITAAENATANVTIQDVNIVISDPNDGSGKAAVTIDVADGAKANVTLDGVNIDTKNTGGVYTNPLTGGPLYITGEAAVQIVGNGDVTMGLDGENTVQGGYDRAGVEKNTTNDSGKGKLTITDENGTDGSLNATGGGYAAGIGGGHKCTGSNITITGSAEVTAQGGEFGSGIGGGNQGSGSNITIGGNAEVTAKGGGSGAGVGGGYDGSGSNITITDSAEVTAKGGGSGSGIGGGYLSTGSEITVSGDAQVKAQGGNAWNYYIFYYGAGAAIGDGGVNQKGSEPEPGREVTPNTDVLTTNGKIEYYAPGANMETDDPIKTVTGTYIPPQDEEKPPVDEEKPDQPAQPTEESAAEAVYTAPLYRVVNQDGKDILHQDTRQDGVLTITVDADFAALTGKLGGIQTLKAQGVDTIVFVTKGASSTFALSDLLSQGSTGDSYTLTHDGSTVTFTLGAGKTDVSDILAKP
ncbi:MAG: hypothetical protein ACI3VD_03005 [Candidatus Limivicinus sp.]